MIIIKIFTPKGNWLTLKMKRIVRCVTWSGRLIIRIGNKNPRAYIFGARIHIFTRDQLDLPLEMLGCQDDTEVMFQVENYDKEERYNLSNVDVPLSFASKTNTNPVIV